jgi:hypothetical protein
MTYECIAAQICTNTEDLSPIGMTSVFHLAVATCFAPSDPSGAHGAYVLKSVCVITYLM